MKRRLFAEKLERAQANLAIESVGRHSGGDQTTGPASKSTAAPASAAITPLPHGDVAGSGRNERRSGRDLVDRFGPLLPELTVLELPGCTIVQINGSLAPPAFFRSLKTARLK